MEKSLKIALFDDSFYPMVDGVANVVDNYCKFLAKKHDVTLFTSKPFLPDDKRVYSYKIVRCKCRNMYWGDYPCPNPANDENFMKELDQKFDIFHIHSPCAVGHAAVKIAKKYDIPVIETLHTRYDLEIKEVVKSWLITKFIMAVYIAPVLKSCDEMITMNEGVIKLGRKFGYKGRTFVLQNGCDFKVSFFSDETIKEFRAKYCNQDEKLLLYVGRMIKAKNIKLIIQTAKELKKKDFKFKCVFVGLGRHLAYFKKLVNKYNLEDKIVFAGQISNRNDLQLFYQSSDLLVFPSYYDTESLTKIEASSVSLPTIFGKGSITSSSVIDGYNGYIAEPNASAFSDKIISIFKDENLYKQVRKTVKETLYKTWEEVIEKAEQEYYEVIKRH